MADPSIPKLSVSISSVSVDGLKLVILSAFDFLYFDFKFILNFSCDESFFLIKSFPKGFCSHEPEAYFDLILLFLAHDKF